MKASRLLLINTTKRKTEINRQRKVKINKRAKKNNVDSLNKQINEVNKRKEGEGGE